MPARREREIEMKIMKWNESKNVQQTKRSADRASILKLKSQAEYVSALFESFVRENENVVYDEAVLPWPIFNASKNVIYVNL